MARPRGRPYGTVRGDYGDHVDPKRPGAVHRGLRRELGAAAPSLSTCWRNEGRNWLDGIQLDPGSADAWRVDSRWLDWDPRSPGVYATRSLAAHAQSYQPQVRAHGYATRGRSAVTDATASAPVPSSLPRTR